MSAATKLPPPLTARMRASGRALRISMIVATPSFSGISMSTMTRSGTSLRNRRSPSLPSGAVATV